MRLTHAVAVVVVFGVLALARGTAHAKIPVIYQSGEDVFVAGDGSLPDEFADEPKLAGFQSGYKCDILGLFWAYLTINDCTAVAFKGDTYIDAKELSDAIRAKHPESSMQVGFWNKHGRWIFLAVIVLGIAAAIFSRSKDAAGSAEA
ncbi:MAG: hypothetical protein R2939_03850 [Kofleriaceae bacterium]